ncbi:MAG: tRNA (adenosine(37)-N6)-threonylcarbamoyltransferase complex dimerization subunit type 1 TsaB [Alphaproteobacteria bacterium]|nr:tRNA (adenosine(37)-N6)-threonylcarbamoyltransferase complex dimerization subunit type 1 TsaB [Alphaproteobacteria bacterium]
MPNSLKCSAAPAAKCLAVNTATKTLSLALVDGAEVLHFYETAETRDQGNLLLNHIRKALDENGLGFADLDVLAVVTGPGSFTGIRIGLATMRGIALAAEKPLLGFSSFDMFAAREPDAVNIIAVESWREELYFAVMDEEGYPLIACGNEAPETFLERFRRELPGNHPIRLSGDAAGALAALLPDAVLAEEEGNAASVARLALERFCIAGGDYPLPVPYYLRAADVTISTKPVRTLRGQ